MCFQAYKQWLEVDVFPAVLPQHHANLLAWLRDRVPSLEQLDPSAWPRNGLELIQAAESVLTLYSDRAIKQPRLRGVATTRDFTDLVCGSEYQSDFDVDAETDAPTAALEVMELQLALQDLEFLAKQLNFKITLDDYRNETPRSIAARLLGRAHAAEVVSDVISHAVRP